MAISDKERIDWLSKGGRMIWVRGDGWCFTSDFTAGFSTPRKAIDCAMKQARRKQKAGGG